MHRLRHKAEAEGGRLLRVLLLRHNTVSANSGSTLWRTRCGLLLCVTSMTNAPTQAGRDWLGSARTSVLAWWLPKAAIVASLLVPVSIRAFIWIVALIWMGAACILNARRCNRTHCRYTGPYYLVMIMPVMALGAGIVTVGIFGWIGLAVIIFGGSGLIWWVTERAWGKFS
jgi:hypothetical protein